MKYVLLYLYCIKTYIMKVCSAFSFSNTNVLLALFHTYFCCSCVYVNKRNGKYKTVVDCFIQWLYNYLYFMLHLLQFLSCLLSNNCTINFCSQLHLQLMAALKALLCIQSTILKHRNIPTINGLPISKSKGNNAVFFFFRLWT